MPRQNGMGTRSADRKRRPVHMSCHRPERFCTCPVCKRQIDITGRYLEIPHDAVRILKCLLVLRVGCRFAEVMKFLTLLPLTDGGIVRIRLLSLRLEIFLTGLIHFLLVSRDLCRLRDLCSLFHSIRIEEQG